MMPEEKARLKIDQLLIAAGRQVQDNNDINRGVVPQEHNDEPASILLGRIRAERVKESPRRGRKSNNAKQMRLSH